MNNFKFCVNISHMVSLLLTFIVIIIFVYSLYNVVKQLIKTNYSIKAIKEFHTKQLKAEYLAH